MDNWKEQIGLLRAITKTTRIIHDAQIFQLKMWPLLVFPKVKKHTFKIDTENHKLIYEFSEIKNNKTNQNGFKQISEWVRILLGEEWITIINSGNIELYKNKRKHGK